MLRWKLKAGQTTLDLHQFTCVTRVSVRDIREGWVKLIRVRGETADSDPIMWFIPKLTDFFDIIEWNKKLNDYADS